MRPGFDESPLNPLPWAAWAIVLPIAAVEIALSLGGLGWAGGAEGAGWRIGALERFALSPLHLDMMLAQGRYPADWLVRFVTYPFVHASFVHAAIATVIAVALAKMVGEVFSGWAVLVVFLGAAIAAGLVYSLIPGIQLALYGAYPPAYGLVGAFTFILWARLGAVHANRYRAFALIALLLLAQTLFTAIDYWMSGRWNLQIVADFTGFAAGFGLSFLVAPGGPAHILRRIRQR